MLQVTQSAKTGETKLETVPPPALQPGFVRVRTAASLISAGTERMIIDLAQKSYLGKAQARPDLVRQIVAKAQKEGLLNTWRNVQSKLEKPMPLGYSAAGVVEAVGPGVDTVQVGDRVAMAGAGYANHAEVNVVPKNLVALIPDGVTDEEAAYSTIAAIGLQGIRLARPEIGDNVVVIGLGLIGLLTVQMLHASGCRVFGVDIDASKVAKALELGAEGGASTDVEKAVDRFTRGYGADLVLITAATKTSGPIELAGTIARRKAQIVAVGAIGMDVPRDLYYKKELELKVSMSYGPGRYDLAYEEGGIDYPYEYVRWTEQRNLDAVLGLMAAKRMDVRALTTHRFPIDRALDAYGLVQTGGEPVIGLLLTYDTERPQAARVDLTPAASAAPRRGAAEPLRIGFVGAGNYASLHLLPHVEKDTAAQLSGLMTATGPSAVQKGEKFGFRFVTTDPDALFGDADTDAVFIATRHSTHADFSVRALQAGKHVFVEKPFVVDEAQLSDVVAAYEAANAAAPTGLMVGTNRRFSPMVRAIETAMRGSGPKQMVYRVNSGAIPPTTWLHAPEEGGGMLVGETCHFFDVMRFLSGAPAVEVYARSLSLTTSALDPHDNVMVVVAYADGSTGTLAYSTVGDKRAPKEGLEVFGGGQAALLDDFRVLDLYRDGKHERTKSLNQDKGQATQIAETVQAFRERGQAPIPFDEVVEAMRVVFAAQRSLASGRPEPVVPADAAPVGGDGVTAEATAQGDA